MRSSCLCVQDTTSSLTHIHWCRKRLAAQRMHVAPETSISSDVLPSVGVMSPWCRLGASGCPCLQSLGCVSWPRAPPFCLATSRLLLSHPRHHVPLLRWSKRSLNPKSPKLAARQLSVSKGNILHAKLRRRILDALPLAAHVGQERVLRLR